MTRDMRVIRRGQTLLTLCTPYRMEWCRDAIAAAIRSRDLSHKGNEKRQAEYVDRTVKKAAAMGMGR